VGEERGLGRSVLRFVADIGRREAPYRTEGRIFGQTEGQWFRRTPRTFLSFLCFLLVSFSYYYLKQFPSRYFSAAIASALQRRLQSRTSKRCPTTGTLSSHLLVRKQILSNSIGSTTRRTTGMDPTNLFTIIVALPTLISMMKILGEFFFFRQLTVCLQDPYFYSANPCPRIGPAQRPLRPTLKPV
jgi:hypothetical protein